MAELNSYMNEWTFSGKVFFLKELEKDFAATVKLRGYWLPENAPAQVVEIPCLMRKPIWEAAKKKGLAQWSIATLSGHIETTVRVKPNGNAVEKCLHVVDWVLDVQ